MVSCRIPLSHLWSRTMEESLRLAGSNNGCLFAPLKCCTFVCLCFRSAPSEHCIPVMRCVDDAFTHAQCILMLLSSGFDFLHRIDAPTTAAPILIFIIDVQRDRTVTVTYRDHRQHERNHTNTQCNRMWCVESRRPSSATHRSFNRTAKRYTINIYIWAFLKLHQSSIRVFIDASSTAHKWHI